jgi:hypothetical protein
MCGATAFAEQIQRAKSFGRMKAKMRKDCGAVTRETSPQLEFKPKPVDHAVLECQESNWKRENYLYSEQRKQTAAIQMARILQVAR